MAYNGKQGRRQGALSRLEIQLKTGMKNTKEGAIELSDADKKRINNEITKLKSSGL